MAGESFLQVTRTPACTAAEVRAFSGFTGIRDISDADISTMILQAQAVVIHDIACRLHRIPLWGLIDGTNTRFSLPKDWENWVLLDANSSGNEKNSLLVYLRAVTANIGPPLYTAATVASCDAMHGQVILSAAPTTLTDQVELTGYAVWSDIPLDLFKFAVILKTSDYIDSRVRAPGAVNLANPDILQKGAPASIGQPWREKYQALLIDLRRTAPKAAVVRTRLPTDPYSDLGYSWRQTVP